MPSFGSTPDWKSTSAIRKVRGSAEQMRTPTGCCDSTFPKIRTSAGIPNESSTQLLSPSTADLERPSAGERQPRLSTRSCAGGLNQLLNLHRARPSDASASDCIAMKTFEVRCERRQRCDDRLNPGSDDQSRRETAGAARRRREHRTARSADKWFAHRVDRALSRPVARDSSCRRHLGDAWRCAMRIEFHGAARGVTGSCHLIECAGKRILIDCGLYQGGRELSEENAQPFGFEPRSIDFVLLTHAHLDHCGRLPLLVNRGFSGEIVCTEASRELARLVLADAARVHEEEAARAARHAPRRMAERIRPLYTIDDAFATMSFFGRSARYDTELHLAPGIVATFLDAGHILGSASILLQLTDRGAQRRVLLSGDLGNAGRPLLRTPAPPPPADVVVMESTYGDRLHKPFAPSVEELYAAVSQTFQRGGNVVIPSFALERAQELLFFLRNAVETDRLPRSMQVF